MTYLDGNFNGMGAAEGVELERCLKPLSLWPRQ